MPRLAKIAKKISKKKGGVTQLHENSRDSQRLRRASAKDDKLARIAAERHKINKPHLLRVAYFQGVANATEDDISNEDIQRLVESYVRRDDDEMATLKAERRPGRPSSNREDLLKQKIATEDREFDTGFWIPDMHDVANRKQLQIWNGEWSALNTLRFVRVTRTGEIKESSFPPRGQS